MLDAIAIATLIGAGLLVISIFTSLISYRVGAPLLLVFLGIGLLAGEDGLGLQFEDVQAAYFVGSIALAIVLFDSGFGTRFHSFRNAVAPAVALSTAGVLLTALLVSVPAYFILGLSWLEAFLLGAIVGSTDAAAVFFLLRVGGIQIRERVRSTLEVESGSNDPMAIFLTLLIVELIVSGAGNTENVTWHFIRVFLVQMSLGITLGLGLGYLAVKLVNGVRFEAGLYPVLIMGVALFIFGTTTFLGGSGFLAVYVAGLLMGNMRLSGGLNIRRFQEGLTWIAQITIFLMLGLLATPSAFPAIAWQALLIAVALIFVVRPIAVWLCLLPFGFTRNETTFISWVGLRGAVSILLAILPIIGGLGSGELLFNVAFMLVLVSLLVQGWTIRPMARWLGLIVPPQIGAVDKVELDLPGKANHELVIYKVAEGSPIAKGERIPHWARPSLVVREGHSMRLQEAGRPRAHDDVYIFATPRLVRLLDRLFASPLELTENDVEYFGHMALSPDVTVGELARQYDFSVPQETEDDTLAEFITDRLGPLIGRGDRVQLGPLELVVREVNPNDGRLSIGLAFMPGATSTPRLPLFRKLTDVAGLVRTRFGKDHGHLKGDGL